MSMTKWMSAKAAGEYFDLKPKTLLSLAARGRIPKQGILRLGRQLRFNVMVIEAELQKEQRGRGGFGATLSRIRGLDCSSQEGGLSVKKT
jgi:hypothetical protein